MPPAAALAMVAVLSGSCSRNEMPDLESLPDVALESADPAVVEQLTTARKDLDRLLEEGADGDRLSVAFGRLGQLYHAYDLLDPAALCYRNASRLDRASYRWAYYLGSLYRRQGRLAEARAEWTRALSLEPDDAPVLLALGNLELMEDRPQAAIPYFERALERDRTCLAARYGLGEAARAMGAFEEAVRHYERILAEQPAATQVHYPLGRSLQRLGREEEAAPHLELGEIRRGKVGGRPGCPNPLEEELQGFKTGSAVHLERGLRAGFAGDHQRELEEYRRAVSLAPEDPIARQGLASALYRSDDFQAAAAEFETAVRLAPDSPNYRYDLGLALLQLGRVERAAASFRAALELDPGYLDAALKLAEIELRTGNSREVRRLADQVLRIDPSSSRARSLRAMAYLDENRRAEAAAELRALLTEYPPGDPEERLRLAMVLAGLGDREVALDQVDEILEIDLEPLAAARAHLARGQLLAARGDRQAALSEFERALELDPSLTSARAALGRLRQSG